MNRCWHLSFQNILLSHFSLIRNPVPIKLLFSAPLLTGCHHNRWLYLFNLADFYTGRPSWCNSKRISDSSLVKPWLFSLLGECVNHYTKKPWFNNLQSRFTLATSVSHTYERFHNEIPCHSLWLHCIHCWQHHQGGQLMADQLLSQGGS